MDAHSDRRGLFILNADLDSLKAKGVIEKISERTEEGYLSRAITLHPMALQTRVVEVGPGLPVHELALPEFSGSRLRRWFGFAGYLTRAAFHARRLALSEGVSFVRAQDPYYSGLIGYLATRWPRIPFCISIHADYDKMEALAGSSPKVMGSHKIAKRLERYLLSRADQVLVISRYIGLYAKRSGARDVVLFRHLPEPAHPELTRPDADPPLISVVARLSKEKFVYDLIDLADILRKRGIAFRICLAGSGAEEKSFREAVQARGLNSFIEMAGFLPRERVLELRARSTVCICLLDGFSLLEAAASGRPVVAYDTEWHKELIDDDRTGVLVPERDVVALADAVERMMRDKSAASRISENMKRKLETEFSPARLRADRIRVYNELIEQGQP